jgi:hypothetical protein
MGRLMRFYEWIHLGQAWQFEACFGCKESNMKILFTMKMGVVPMGPRYNLHFIRLGVSGHVNFIVSEFFWQSAHGTLAGICKITLLRAITFSSYRVAGGEIHLLLGSLGCFPHTFCSDIISFITRSLVAKQYDL